MAIHKLESSFAKVDSSDETMDCHADKSARNDNLLDSSKSLLLSSRADEVGVAIHNSAPAESNQINSAHKVRNLESVQGDWGFKGDKGSLPSSSPVPLEKDSPQTTLESSNNAQKVESMESNFAKLDSNMDCRATASAFARNDRKTKNLSKSQAEAVEMRNRCFQAVGAGIYLSGNEQAHRAESAIYRSNATPLSPKAESLLKVAYAA